MTADPVANARAAQAAGQAALAVDLGWKAVRPAVISQDTTVIRAVMQLAEEIATTADQSTREEAETLASYCAACIIQPRDTVPSVFSMKRLFSFGRSKKICPDCAESIQAEAKVCRYCGYRYPA